MYELVNPKETVYHQLKIYLTIYYFELGKLKERNICLPGSYLKYISHYVKLFTQTTSVYL